MLSIVLTAAFIRAVNSIMYGISDDIVVNAFSVNVNLSEGSNLNKRAHLNTASPETVISEQSSRLMTSACQPHTMGIPNLINPLNPLVASNNSTGNS